MKWWYKFCDRVVELVTKKSNNAGSFKFRNRCRSVWYLIWMVLIAVSSACPIQWMVVIPSIVLFLTILGELYQGEKC